MRSSTCIKLMHITAAFCLLSVTVQQVFAQGNKQSYSDSVPFNPIIRDKFTADPAALVHNDTVYLYTGRDEAPKGQARYVMNEWLCYSSTDMLNWKERPSPLKTVSRC